MTTMFSGSRQGLLAAAALAALAGCGGSTDLTDEPAAAQTFEQRAQALAAKGGGTPSELTPVAASEAQQRSRDWAVGAIFDTAAPATGSVVTVPPLYFGLVFAVDAAARGDTRAALREQVAPASSAVQAALQRGLTRSVRASATATFDPVFIDAITVADDLGTWASLTLRPLSPQQLASEPNLRLAVDDSARGSWAWPNATAYDGVHQFANGARISVPMVRVQGPVLEQAGSGYTASSMAVGKGHWLVRVVPQGTPAAFGPAGLSAALAAVVPTLTVQAATTAATGTWELPATSTSQTAGLADRRGMALAMNEGNANLRGVDGGGTYLKAPAGSGWLSVEASGVNYWAAQSFEFIFSPLNVYGPGGSAGAVSVFGNLQDQPPCPTEPADLRPYFLALVQPGGNIAMLSRMDGYRSSACGRSFVVVVPPTPSGP
jgi:hypothetical protein